MTPAPHAPITDYNRGWLDGAEAEAKRAAADAVERRRSGFVDLTLEESERQAVLLALAALSVERPGWDNLLNALALRIDNEHAGRAVMYDLFRETRRP